MNGNKFDNVISQYRDAARTAYKQMGDTLGIPMLDRAEHFRALKNMTPDDLDVLSEEYGEDQVAEYLARLAGG